ncbi:MAG: DsbA family protein [Patescibacteria group bacterium]
MDFLKRNFPVLFLLSITILIFAGIIIASKDETNTDAPSLEVASTSKLVPAHAYTLGNPEAVVTIVEFSDFQCPACKTAAPVVKTLLRKYDGDVRLVYRNFPLPQHRNAEMAAIAAQAAGQQGKFWEYHDVLFANQDKLREQDLVKYADDLELDVAQFEQDLKNEIFENVIAEDIRDARAIGVSSTPTFYVNGEKAELRAFTDLETLIIQAIEKARTDENSDEETEESTSTTSLGQPSVASVTKELGPAEIDAVFGSVNISFSENTGFEPVEPSVMLGQKVVWTNASDKTITLKQNKDLFSEFESTIQIPAGETFEFRPYTKDLWVYEEVESGLRGSMLIKDAIEFTVAPNQ